MNYVSSNIIVALLTYAYASLRKYAAKTPGKYKGEMLELRISRIKKAKLPPKMGLVNHVVPVAELEQEGIKWSLEILEKVPWRFVA